MDFVSKTPPNDVIICNNSKRPIASDLTMSFSSPPLPLTVPTAYMADNGKCLESRINVLQRLKEVTSQVEGVHLAIFSRRDLLISYQLKGNSRLMPHPFSLHMFVHACLACLFAHVCSRFNAEPD